MQFSKNMANSGIPCLVSLLACLVSAAPAAEPSTARAPTRDENHTFARRLRSWREIQRQNIVMQQRDYSCGAAALATIARYYWGDKVDEDFFLDALGELLTDEEARDRVKNGLAMSDLRRAAVKTGYQAVVGKLTFEKLTESRVPLIVGITVDGHDHFVVYRGTDWKWVYLADPIRGNVRVPIPDFAQQWQKNAVLAIHKPGSRVKESSALSLRAEELELGQLNWQWLRTVPSRHPVGSNSRSGGGL
jgi:predicted double-glycine peptidase